jgi:hypothetical protein
MVATAQIETRLAYESQTPSFEPASGGTSGVARQSNKPDFLGGSSKTGQTESARGSDAAYSVEISDEAQRVAASEQANAPKQTSAEPQGLDATVETSATADRGSVAGAAPEDGGSETNQVTSFQSERTGNDTRNETEAGRTLGQVIDTFA